ncbi:MAG TPA: tetratricopeptide repeat-containing protein kinase family protein, partial [Candidatus Acidoferrum sp.]|nr:tetratricopeptide repeat-containing protein kinase family protein [Candidatus Acidoferrum sp.]
WLADQPRSFARILDVFRAAGRGLAAAHAAGIIHRDFKPENVLVDRHDRPRVTDFGLSRASHDSDPEDEAADASAPVADAALGHLADPLSSPSRLSIPLTWTGGVLGTPSYMAPEQHLGGKVDARSDQFAFCVALHEALHGQHPFHGSPAERLGNAIAGRVAPAPPQSSVPRWCRQALLRGLSPAPENRFDSMEALLAALTPRPASRRRWQIALAASLGILVASAGAYALGSDRPATSPGPRCDLGAQRLAGVWDQPRKRQLSDAFQRSGARGADLTWSAFSAILDDRASAWAAMHNQACAATHVGGTQSPAVLDLRMECLDRKRQEMKDLVDVYAEKPDQPSLDRAVAAADKLSSVAACADVANLRAVVPLPDDPATRAKVASIRQRLSRSRALYEAGRYKQGSEYMASLKQEADALGYAPLAAEAANALAAHLSQAGKLKEAEKVLFDAATQAVDGKDWNQEAEAWLELLATYGREGRVQDVLLIGRVAELTVRRAHGDDSLRARLEINTAQAQHLTGNLEGALRHYRRAEELSKNSFGVHSARYARLLNDVGSTLIDLGRNREARGYLDRALGLQRTILRPDHPDIATSLWGAGAAYVNLGLVHQGLEMYQRSVEIFTLELGPEHPLTTRVLQSTAHMRAELGDVDGALKLLANVLSSRRRVLDPHDMALGIAYWTMGEVQRLAGRHDQAEQTIRQAVEQLERAGPPENLGIGHALTILGRIHNDQGHHRDALRECRRGFDILARALDPDSIMLTDTRACLGEALIATGDIEAARKELERAVALIDSEDLWAHYTAGVRFQLARALHATPGDRPRALELARSTRDALAAAEGDNRKMIARIDAWLATHGGPGARSPRRQAAR